MPPTFKKKKKNVVNPPLFKLSMNTNHEFWSQLLYILTPIWVLCIPTACQICFFHVLCIFLQEKKNEMWQKGCLLDLFPNTSQHKNAGLAP